MSETYEASEREAPVSGHRVDSARDWTSIWFDLLRIQQFLAAREQLPTITDHGPSLFTRNALWDAAIAAYGRCYNDGSRRAKIDGLIKRLPADLQACHQRLKALRNTQVAHHDDAEEQRTLHSTAVVVFDAAGTALGVRVWVHPAIGHADEQHFQPLIARLAQIVQDKIDRLASQIVADQDLDQLRRIAAPHDDTADGLRSHSRLLYNAWAPS